MAKRNKKSRAKKAKAQNSPPTPALAAEHLDSGRFRDAAADYKHLLKGERRPEWIAGLAQAYAGRAEHLASRGMINEAIALWRNRAEACNEALADPRYLDWLLAAANVQEVARLYSQDAARLAGDKGMAGLQARLAAAALAGGHDLAAHLPADDPVVSGLEIAETALAAYERGDDEALEAALQAIPFRSPYRDFRSLMKALTCREQDPDAAADRVARVPADTPFAGIRTALETVVRAEDVSQQTIVTLPADIRSLAAPLAGWSEDTVKRAIPLARLGPDPDQQALLDFVLTHSAALGQRFATEAAFALAGMDMQRQRRITKLFKGRSEADIQRLIAQTCEAHGHIGQAINEWRQLLDVITDAPEQGDISLRCALIHRHIADLMQPPRRGSPLAPAVVEHLVSSLELDPYARDSHLRLVEHFLHEHDLKAARRWSNQALEHFPDDADCLFHAAQTAIAGGAYKKAVGYAQRILAIDAINPRARGLLVDAYLSHARKQLRGKKPAAATRELDHAEQWTRGALDAGRIQILRGLVTLREQGADAAANALQAGVNDAGGGLTGHFYLLLEASRSGQSLPKVMRAAALLDVKTLGDGQQVLALARALDAMRDGQHDTSAGQAALAKLAPAIKQAANADLDRADAELVCEILLRYRQYTALKRYAGAALKRWPGRAPLFVFYRTMGRLAGRPLDPWDRECAQLDMAYEDADEQGDTRTANRIGAMLDAAMSGPTYPGDDPFPDPFLENVDYGDDNLPDPAEQEQLIVNGELNPAFRMMLELVLGAPDLARLEKAFKYEEPIPKDIRVKLEAFSRDGPGTPMPEMQIPATPKPTTPKRAPPKPAAPKPATSQQKTPRDSSPGPSEHEPHQSDFWDDFE